MALCPSILHLCGKLISFRYVEQHIKQCPGKTEAYGNYSFNWFTLAKSDFETEEALIWPTKFIVYDSRMFLLRLGRFNEFYSVEVAMLGSPDECNRRTSRIVVILSSAMTGKTNAVGR